MRGNLQQWRKRNRLTQVEAATLLGVSQPYLSLIEKGLRPLTADLRSRMRTFTQTLPPRSTEDFPSQLSALGYPAFAHVPPRGARLSPESVLISILSQPDADARVVEALPWLIRTYQDLLDFPRLARQAKLLNLQNRLGFLLQIAGTNSPALAAAKDTLDQARLLREDTLCWESMPAAAREWIRKHRSPVASHWNIVTTVPQADQHDH